MLASDSSLGTIKRIWKRTQVAESGVWVEDEGESCWGPRFARIRRAVRVAEGPRLPYARLLEPKRILTGLWESKNHKQLLRERYQCYERRIVTNKKLIGV
ncbi:hypothetical protein Tcan_14648 [Toxocara canis]|uniref:Uncharacterized protein n=1 Tax=Toxocara canis TaxID=6265 RepID=A0A0B2V408_TOXCA|nr:hypothetical protein Tcan_14648 [Toxocara canis]